MNMMEMEDMIGLLDMMDLMDICSGLDGQKAWWGHDNQSGGMTNQRTWWPIRGHNVTFDRIYWSFWSCFNYMKKQMLCLWAYTWLMPIWKSSLFLSGSPCLLLYLFVFYLLLKYFQCLSSLPLYQYCPQNPPPLQILTLLPLKTICDQPKCILLDLACFQGTWKSTPSSRRWQYNLSELQCVFFQASSQKQL